MTRAARTHIKAWRSQAGLALALVAATLLACLAAFTGAAGAAGAARGVEPTLDPSKQETLQRTLAVQMQTHKVPGAIVGMWFPGTGDWVTGAGEGEIGSGVAPRPTDHVRIGSITKSFTATAVLQLVDRRKLALSDRLSKYVPWVPNARHITVRQLLNMTSGLYNFTDADAFWARIQSDPTARWTPRRLVKLAVAHPRVFRPGARYMYCNTNYVLLGMIIEKVTGRPANRVITSLTIKRLGLKHTSFPMATGLREPYMHGYVPADGEPNDTWDLVDTSIYSPTPYWTAGAMVSTLGDLKVWMRAIATGKLLSARMHRAQLRFSAPNTASYGLGVMNGRVMFGHSGEVPGYNSSMYYIPALKATSITLIDRYPSAVEGAADQINIALIEAMATDPADGFAYPDPADFSDLGWSEAFAAAHEKFSHEYAFGDWKGVDWQALRDTFLPRVVKAEAAGDEQAYYLALHEYVCSIPDGHLSITAEDKSKVEAIGRALAGRGYGMAIAELDDQRVTVAALIPGGPADLAGIETGAELVSWNGIATRTAIGRVDIGAVPYKSLTPAVGNENPKATQASRRLDQARLLTRAPIEGGAPASVVFLNPGAAGAETVLLTPVDDGGATLSLLDFGRRPDFFADPVDYRILPSGHGYVHVTMEFDPLDPGAYPSRVFEQFRAAITSFVAAGVPGVILDLRGNYGGSDQLAADLCGFFTTSPAFYEETEYYDKRTDSFLRLTIAETGPTLFVDHLSVEPQTPYYGGPVVVLVNPGTTSSGEGLPMVIPLITNGTVIGFHGTNGSFGMVGGEIALPGGYGIHYPYGRSVDRYGVVQLDSRNGIGGVAPSVRVPKTLANVLAYAGGADVELQYAVDYLEETAD